MKFLRDETVAALNDVIRSCLDAVEVHRAAADALAEDYSAGDTGGSSGGDSLARRLRALAAGRVAAAESLEQEVRRRDELPVAEPHVERLLIEKAVAELEATLTGSLREHWLDHCRARETAVEQAAEAALALALGEDLRREIERLRDEAAEASAKLA